MNELDKVCRRRRLPSIVVLVVFLVLPLCAVVSRYGWPSTDVVFVIGAVLGLAVIITAYVCKMLTRCPRCGHRFYHTLFFHNPFARRCVHCALPISAKWVGTEQQTLLLGQWYLRPPPRGPIPDVGLRCPKCRYALAGLLVPRCPECGYEVDLDQLFKNLS